SLRSAALAAEPQAVRPLKPNARAAAVSAQRKLRVMFLLAALIAAVSSAHVREGCQSATATESAIRRIVALDWNRIRMDGLQDFWPFPLVLRERMTADGNTSQPTGPGDGIFLLAYEGRVIAGQRECGDYFVVDQQVGREQGLTLMHLVRTYAWA